MTRNPYARALRIHAQKIVPDKRDKALRAVWNEEVERGITDDERVLLAALDDRAAEERGECSGGPDGSTKARQSGSDGR